jgi:hypothetical protein
MSPSHTKSWLLSHQSHRPQGCCFYSLSNWLWPYTSERIVHRKEKDWTCTIHTNPRRRQAYPWRFEPLTSSDSSAVEMLVCPTAAAVLCLNLSLRTLHRVPIVRWREWWELQTFQMAVLSLFLTSPHQWLWKNTRFSVLTSKILLWPYALGFLSSQPILWHSWESYNSVQFQYCLPGVKPQIQ